MPVIGVGYPGRSTPPAVANSGGTVVSAAKTLKFTGNVAVTATGAEADVDIPISLVVMPAKEASTAYTLANTDLAGGVVKLFNAATAQVITVPSGLTNKAVFTAIQDGAGQVSFAAGAGVSIRSPDGKLKLRVQYSGASLVPSQVETDVYYLYGDITL